mgnify:CR=1 FL=1
MEFHKLRSNKGNEIYGPLILKPKVFHDERGFFYENWNFNNFNKIIGKEIIFKQENISFSSKGVLRGLHYQLDPKSQSKLIRCTKGEVLDVIVDLRLSSETFGEYISILLSEENKLQFWIPKGFAHGFLTLSEYAEFSYKVDEFWEKSLEKSISWNDKILNIDWPISRLNGNKVLLSDKDKNAFSLSKAIEEEYIFS